MTRRRVIDTSVASVLGGALLVGTCVLPYWFPPRDFVVGASFVVGFNNGVSYAAYVVLVVLSALLLARRLPALKNGLRTAPSKRFPLLGRWAVGAVVFSHVALFAAVYGYKGRFVFGESLYFQSLLYRMTLGETPYVDFSFYYGPMILYPGMWLVRLLGLDAGYAIWFVITYVVGLMFLYTVLRVCVTSERERVIWFAFLAIGLFNPLVGLNVTFTRYLLPTVVFLAAMRFFRLGGWRHGIVAVASLATALTYSFEVAALSLGGTLLIWLVCVAGPEAWTMLTNWLRWILQETSTRPDESKLGTYRKVGWRGVGLLIPAGALCLAFFLLVDPTGYALRQYSDTALSYSGGAHAVPIYPHLPFIAISTLTIAALAAVTRSIATLRDQRLGLFLGVYAVVALVTQRAAFGPAEPNHFAYFGLPTFLLALFVAARAARSTKVRALLACTLLIGIMLPMQYYHFTEFLPFLARLAPATATESGENAGPSPGETLEQGLAQVVRTLGADRQYLMYGMAYNSLVVHREFRLGYPAYFTMLLNARDAQGIRRAIDDVRAHGAIVVFRKQDLGEFRLPSRSAGVWRVLDLLSGAHTRGSHLAGVLIGGRRQLTAPFIEFVQTEYVQVYDQGQLIAFGPG
jgi:hypothetical protein